MDEDHGHSHGIGGSPECRLCPVCVLLQAMTTSRPEVTHHLLSAARELALALKAVAESQVEAYDRARARSEGLRRINIDEPGQGER